MRHCHAVGSLAIDIVEVVKNATKLFMYRSRVGRVAEIEIPSKKFIRTFASEDNFDVFGC